MRRQAIALACDRAYAPYTTRLAARLAATHPQRTFDICIFSTENFELPQACRDAGVILHTLSNLDAIPAAAAAGRHGIATYIRLLIPELEGIDYGRILYLDTDIVCDHGGLDGLLDAEMGDHCIGAVRDNKQWRSPRRRVPEFVATRQANLPYFNAGVLLIHTEGWRQREIGARAIRALVDCPQAILHSDQSALNIVVRGEWAEMSPIWNWQYTHASRFFVELVEPRLIHFIGPTKPWNDSSGKLPGRFRRFFQPDDTPPAGPTWPANLRQSLWKHYLSSGAMKTYLDRFEHPWQLRDAASDAPLARG